MGPGPPQGGLGEAEAGTGKQAAVWGRGMERQVAGEGRASGGQGEEEKGVARPGRAKANRREKGWGAGSVEGPFQVAPTQGTHASLPNCGRRGQGDDSSLPLV